MTLSSKNGFIQRHFRPKPGFIQSLNPKPETPQNPKTRLSTFQQTFMNPKAGTSRFSVKPSPAGNAFTNTDNIDCPTCACSFDETWMKVSKLDESVRDEIVFEAGRSKGWGPNLEQILQIPCNNQDHECRWRCAPLNAK